MRMAFGLLSLLIAVAIIVFLFSIYFGGSAGAAKAGKKARAQAIQISGRSSDGTPATESLTYADAPSSGLDRLVVQTVVPGGAMDAHFGLMPGDEIVEVMGLKVRDVPMGDADLAKAWVIEAYQKGQPIVVIRTGEQVTLPLPKPATPAAAAPGGVQVPAGAPAGGSGAQDQLKSITDQIRDMQRSPLN